MVLLLENVVRNISVQAVSILMNPGFMFTWDEKLEMLIQLLFEPNVSSADLA